MYFCFILFHTLQYSLFKTLAVVNSRIDDARCSFGSKLYVVVGSSAFPFAFRERTSISCTLLTQGVWNANLNYAAVFLTVITDEILRSLHIEYRYAVLAWVELHLRTAIVPSISNTVEKRVVASVFQIVTSLDACKELFFAYVVIVYSLLLSDSHRACRGRYDTFKALFFGQLVHHSVFAAARLADKN